MTKRDESGLPDGSREENAASRPVDPKATQRSGCVVIKHDTGNDRCWTHDLLVAVGATTCLGVAPIGSRADPKNVWLGTWQCPWCGRTGVWEKRERLGGAFLLPHSECTLTEWRLVANG